MVCEFPNDRGRVGHGKQYACPTREALFGVTIAYQSFEEHPIYITQFDPSRWPSFHHLNVLSILYYR
jgi:hypothetical protein